MAPPVRVVPALHGGPTDKLDILCPLLLLWSKLDFEPKKLVDLGATTSTIKRADVDEDLLTARDWIDESETTVVIPACQLAFETHDGR